LEISIAKAVVETDLLLGLAAVAVAVASGVVAGYVVDGIAVEEIALRGL
jgi:hypothetical protein